VAALELLQFLPWAPWPPDDAGMANSARRSRAHGCRRISRERRLWLAPITKVEDEKKSGSHTLVVVEEINWGKIVHSVGLKMEKRKENHEITKKSGKPSNRRVRVSRD
jgi:hypothetical protein